MLVVKFISDYQRQLEDIDVSAIVKGESVETCFVTTDLACNRTSINCNQDCILVIKYK